MRNADGVDSEKVRAGSSVGRRYLACFSLFGLTYSVSALCGTALLLGATPFRYRNEFLLANGVAVGACLAVATGGSFSTRDLRRWARLLPASRKTGYVGIAFATLNVAVVLKFVERLTIARVVATMVAAALLLGLWRLITPTTNRTVQASDIIWRPWLAVSATVAALVGGSAAVTFFKLADTYPLSSYPMYSNSKSYSTVFEEVRFVGITSDDVMLELRPSASRLVLVRLARTRDYDTLEGVVRTSIRRSNVAHVEVLYEVRRVSSPPGKPRLDTVSSELVMVVEL